MEMNLAGLTAYAREKYHISEQHKWADFPGFSVLADPATGKWAALLMRQWDSEAGEQIERCDIKCGRSCLEEYRVPWLSGPFRMHGQKWVGIRFDEGTDPEIVCGLLDRALGNQDGLSGKSSGKESSGKENSGKENSGSGYLYVLGRDFKPWKKRLSQSGTSRADSRENTAAANIVSGADGKQGRVPVREGISTPFYVETPLPEAGTSPAYSENTSPAYSYKKYYQDSPIPGFNDKGLSAREDEILSAKPPGSKPVRDDEILPEKIRGMKRLYKYGDGTFRERSMNFYIQGKYMEDYEDDVPWHGDFRRYFPTYHDLRNDQLRGYFTWRTDIRRGIFKKVPDSVVYIYIYELLNVIGASSPEESLQKLKEFEEGYLGPERTGSEGSGAGAAGPVSEKEGENAIRQNLHKWMLEFAVLHGVDPETACRYADPEMIQRDHFLEVLRDPRHFEDREVFDALCLFAGSKITSSPVIKKTEEGIPLFAKAWRYACSHFNENGRELFNHCFGDLKTKVWFPLENVMYGARRPAEPVSYILNPCRKYTFDGRFWKESSYLKILFDKKRLTGLLHETDRQLRLYLKAGGRLKEMSDEAWAAPYVQAVIEADRTAKIEAAKPKVHIRFSDLDQIRRDALATRDSLLTEEERQEKYVTTVETALSEYSDLMNSGTNNPQFDNSEKAETSPERSVISAGTEPALDDVFAVTSPNHLPGEKHSADDIKNFSEENRLAGKMEGKEPCSPALPLDENQRDLLLALLRGESVRERITKQHGMPEIVADGLNEALFDEIGDSVVECDGDEIILVEDYREDIMELLGEG
ncbi:TerB N-terminal domain-containing protein [Sarcina sp. DSM 11001]|uniref:TerB N-terminal domain-containing protein n=1 Tax=Sarcina sp. DSM 11001 TaxID=1798184 RepID=UPI000B81AF9A|nr:TerB N-terminal domain-containing protein [Sarcina sp. DSM 11001]